VSIPQLGVQSNAPENFEISISQTLRKCISALTIPTLKERKEGGGRR